MRNRHGRKHEKRLGSVKKSGKEPLRYKEGVTSSRRSASGKEKRRPSNDSSENSRRRKSKKKRLPRRQKLSSGSNMPEMKLRRGYSAKRRRENEKLERRC